MREKSTLLNEILSYNQPLEEIQRMREKSTLLNEILSYSQPLEEIQRNQWERSPHFSMKYYPTANH